MVIPSNTDINQVQLRLHLKESDYQSYRGVLQTIGGKVILSRSRLEPRVTKSGARLAFIVPAGLFATGDYLFTLTGVTAGGEVEELSKSIFRVEKK